MTTDDDGYSEQKLIDPFLDQMITLGAKNISCNWSDRKGGYVVSVSLSNDQSCEAVNTNRVKAYEDAVVATRILVKSSFSTE